MDSQDSSMNAIRAGEPPDTAQTRGRAERPHATHTWSGYLMKWRRALLGLTMLMVATLVFAGWWLSVRFSSWVVNDALVGQSEVEILRESGAPVSDRPGYHALGPNEPPPLPQAPIQSLQFRPGSLLHPKGGTLHVWLMRRDGKWLCFESCWYSDDVQF
jgi:hypothetical protein